MNFLTYFDHLQDNIDLVQEYKLIVIVFFFEFLS
jgi:hypothetical protein